MIASIVHVGQTAYFYPVVEPFPLLFVCLGVLNCWNVRQSALKYALKGYTLNTNLQMRSNSELTQPCYVTLRTPFGPAL